MHHSNVTRKSEKQSFVITADYSTSYMHAAMLSTWSQLSSQVVPCKSNKLGIQMHTQQPTASTEVLTMHAGSTHFSFMGGR
jgi:hypothetical protein